MKKIIPLLSFVVIISCQHPAQPDQLLNKKASLPASFSLSDLHQNVVTSFINRKDSTMSILYSNNAKSLSLPIASAATLLGDSVTLVTWRQQDDPHWFGARIPGDLISVETVNKSMSKDTLKTQYRKYAGKDLLAVTDTSGSAERTQFLLSQKASIIP